jgi:glycosyltransferase involved in cell wall biosynthesis
MKVINIYNGRRERGGEDVIFELISYLLSKKDIDVEDIRVEELDYNHNILSRVRAFFSGIFSIASFLKFSKIFKVKRPDIVHIHNIYPSISPSIFLAARLTKTPIVYHSHNFLLTCPVGSHFQNNTPCKKCVKGFGFNALKYNCRGNILESIGYWLRFLVSRIFGFFYRYCSAVIVVSEFSKKTLIESGFIESKIILLPNSVNVPNNVQRKSNRKYILFVGRINVEKGIYDFINAAHKLPHLNFLVVGDGPLKNKIEKSSSSNTKFVGWKDKDSLKEIYSKSLLAIVPSWGYETFGLTAAEAMSYGLPTIVANRGALNEFSKNEKTAYTYEPGNTNDLCQKIVTLISDDKEYNKLSDSGREFIKNKFSHDLYVSKLLLIYQSVIKKESKYEN